MDLLSATINTTQKVKESEGTRTLQLLITVKLEN